MSYSKHNKGLNTTLDIGGIEAPGFSVTRGSINISTEMTTPTPTQPTHVANKAYADAAAGGAGSLQDAYEGGNTIDINTLLDGNLIFRDSGLTPVFTVSESMVTAGTSISMGGNKITGLGPPTGGSDAATMAYVDGIGGGGVSNLQTAYAGGNTIDITTGVGGDLLFRDSSSNPILSVSEVLITADQPLNMGSNKITDLAGPTNAGDAATKTYVDGAYTFANVGAGAGEVFRNTTGTTVANFRTIDGVDSIAVTNVGDVVQVAWSTGLQIINASTFAGATADVKINAALATATDGAIVLVDDGFSTSETLAAPLVFPSAVDNLTIIFGKIEFDFTYATNGTGVTPALSEKLFDIPSGLTNLTIRGGGAGTQTDSAPANLPSVTEFVWNATAGDSYVANFEDCHNVSFENMRFTGKNQLVDTSGGIKTTINTTDGTWGLKFVNVFMQKMTRTMIDVDTPVKCNFQNLRLTLGGTSGVSFRTGGSSNLLTDCYASSFYECGFEMIGTTASSLISCAAEGAGLGFLFDGTEGCTSIACGSEVNTFRDASFPGHAVRVSGGAKGTGIYNLYSKGMLNNVNQVYIDVGSAIGTDIVNPVMISDKAFVPINSIVVGAGASATRIVSNSTMLKLPENGANTTELLDNTPVDTLLEYDGYFLNYGSRQRGPIFRDTAGNLRYLECSGAGAVSGVAWTPP